MMTVWSLLISLCVFLCVGSKPMRNFNKYVLSTEHVQIEKVSGEVYRHKRSTAIIFPNKMSFRFPTEAGKVTLNLERTSNNHHSTRAPIYTIEDTGITYRNCTVKDNFALYQDAALGCSVLVKYPGGQLTNYKLAGAFRFQGQSYEISPLDESYLQKRDTSIHRIRRLATPDGSFLGDELLPPPDTAGMNMPNQYQPPYPGINMREDSKPSLIELQENLLNDDGVDILPATIRYSEGFDYLLPPGMSPHESYEGRRGKRDAETLYIEYMVVSDYKNTENWKARVAGDTDDEKLNNAFDAMYEYYQLIVNGIDVRFRTATSSGPNIRVVLASLLLSTSAETSPWITKNKLSEDSVDDAGCLFDFAMWKKATYSILPTHDHAALFTGYDLAMPSSRSTLGMAYLSSMCAEAWAVSENEETFNAIVIHIAGHELGHNIGSRHDGSGNGCSPSAMYLMAGQLPQVYDPAIAANPWTFSMCSQSSINSFLRSLGESNCLQNEPTSSRLNDFPGLIYSADEQCNMTYGHDAVLCRNNLYYQWDTICYALQCKLRDDSSCIGRIFPFDGTPCGNKMWCQQGLCVYSEDAPVTHETCVFGDDPHSACRTENSCGENNYFSREVSCCGTCLAAETTTSLPSQSTINSKHTSISTYKQTAPSSRSSHNSSTSLSYPWSSSFTTFTLSGPVSSLSSSSEPTSVSPTVIKHTPLTESETSIPNSTESTPSSFWSSNSVTTTSSSFIPKTFSSNRPITSFATSASDVTMTYSSKPTTPSVMSSSVKPMPASSNKPLTSSEMSSSSTSKSFSVTSYSDFPITSSSDKPVTSSATPSSSKPGTSSLTQSSNKPMTSPPVTLSSTKSMTSSSNKPTTSFKRQTESPYWNDSETSFSSEPITSTSGTPKTSITSFSETVTSNVTTTPVLSTSKSVTPYSTTEHSSTTLTELISTKYLTTSLGNASEVPTTINTTSPTEVTSSSEQTTRFSSRRSPTETIPMTSTTTKTNEQTSTTSVQEHYTTTDWSTLQTRRTTIKEQSEDLSYELQTMISLFLTAAMVL